MQQKDILGLLIACGGIFGATLITTVWKRARDFVFFAMIVLVPMTERVDVNFVSRDFYRGTTRGIEFSLVDILSISLLLGTLIMPRKGQSRAFWPASFGLMLIFFLYCCINVGMADPHLFGLFELAKMVRGMTIFLAVAFFVRSEREVKLLLWALATIICWEGVQALKQRVLWHMERVPGTVDDSNSLSVLLVTTVAMFVAGINSRVPTLLKLLCGAAIAAAGLAMLLTLSRAGIIILCFILLAATFITMSYKLTTTKFVVVATVLVFGSGAGYKMWPEIKARFAETNIEVEYGNNRRLGRGYYIKIARAIVDDKFFGVGLNNWSYCVSGVYGPLLGYKFVHYRGTDVEPSYKIPPGSNVDDAQAAPAHSLAALTAGELGIPGLILFALLWIRWFQMAFVFLLKRTSDPMRRIGVGIFFGLCGIFLQSLTEWVFRHSPIYYTIHILLGVLASIYYTRRQEMRAAKRALNQQPDVSVTAPPPFISAQPAM
jgi:hypothetical protein